MKIKNQKELDIEKSKSMLFRKNSFYVFSAVLFIVLLYGMVTFKLEFIISPIVIFTFFVLVYIFYEEIIAIWNNYKNEI